MTGTDFHLHRLRGWGARPLGPQPHATRMRPPPLPGSGGGKPQRRGCGLTAGLHPAPGESVPSREHRLRHRQPLRVGLQTQTSGLRGPEPAPRGRHRKGARRSRHPSAPQRVPTRSARPSASATCGDPSGLVCAAREGESAPR